MSKKNSELSTRGQARCLTPGLKSLNVVLVEPSHPGNIGAAARAMKTMGLEHLSLVNPKHFPHDDAIAMASGADDILENAKVFSSLQDAKANSSWTVGTSARLRSITWPVFTVKEWVGEWQARGTEQQVSLVFGRERTGLTNDELDLCDVLLHVPTDEHYGSLNLAAAVQIVAYEARMACLGDTKAWLGDRADHSGWPKAEDMEHFYTHLEQSLTEIGFLKPENPRKLMRRLRRLYNRAELDINELNMLRGMLAAFQSSNQT